MAPSRPDAEHLDILVEDDLIADIGEELVAPDCSTVELAGRIVIPGLVNAHLHTWQTALRFIGADWTLPEYLHRMHGDIAQRYTPEDVHIGNLGGALNQINCGTTTLGDWCHNTPTPEHADAALSGLVESGIRAVFLSSSLREVDRILDGPTHDLVTVGMAIAGPQLSTADVAKADLRAAAVRGLVASMHQSAGAPTPAWDAVLAAGLFGPHSNIVHGAGLPDDWIARLVDVGATFTTTPENELVHGHCAPITGGLLTSGSAPSLGTDTETAVSGEVLNAARIALAHQRGLDHERDRAATGMMSATTSITCKQALSWATVEGARALGLADKIGRLEPGMQADLVVIDATAPNLWASHDPVATALHAGVANIDSVMVAGSWRKHGHKLQHVDLDGIRARLSRSAERLLTT
jgi:5-methylthioadenosine/S-adenosylhomocysteine deaminase